MNQAQYDAGFVERLKLKGEAISKLKELESEPHPVSDSVSNVCVVLALGV